MTSLLQRACPFTCAPSCCRKDFFEVTWAAVRAGSVDPNLADSTLAPHQVRGHLALRVGAKVSCCSTALKWMLAAALPRHSMGRCILQLRGSSARLARYSLALLLLVHRRLIAAALPSFTRPSLLLMQAGSLLGPDCSPVQAWHANCQLLSLITATLCHAGHP